MDANARLLPFFLVIFVVAPIMSYCTAGDRQNTRVYLLTLASHRCHSHQGLEGAAHRRFHLLRWSVLLFATASYFLSTDPGALSSLAAIIGFAMSGTNKNMATAL